MEIFLKVKFLKTALTLLTFIFLLNTTTCNNANVRNPMCEIWININYDNNKLKVENLNGKHLLTYIGYEKNSKGEDIFFLSKTNDIKINDNDLIFSLKDFMFSKKPIDFSSNHFENVEYNDIPNILKFHLRIKAIIKDDLMELNKVSDIYDSKSEKLTFRCFDER